MNFFMHKILNSPFLPHFFFQSLTERQIEKIEKALEQDIISEGEKILCKFCQHPITSSQKKIEVNGQYHHIFSNPIGITYEIGCFSSANGCINEGAPTLEYTWFTGFAWRFALCSNCYAHLGWFYQSDNDSFYALILESLDSY